MHYTGGVREFRQVDGKWNGTIRLTKDMSA